MNEHTITDVDAVRRAGSRAEQYRELLRALTGLLDGERDGLANMANFAALVYSGLPELNWAGFYLWRDGQLVLGPFQGRPACVRIDAGRGVCGAAVVRRASVRVDDVHAFPGHIACDAASRSELVVPFFSGATLLGVFDLDSPRTARFDAVDEQGIHSALQVLTAATRLSWPAWPAP